MACLPRLHERCSTDQRGAVLVEMAIGLLLILTLCAGILEYTGVFAKTIDTAAAVSSATRTGATSTSSGPGSDYSIVQSAIQKSGAKRADINKIVVYQANDDNAGPPAECLDSPNPPAVLRCNVYTTPDFSLDEGSFNTLANGKSWKVSQRNHETDYIGVWLQVTRVPLFNLVASPKVLTDWQALKIMPPPVGSATEGWKPAVKEPTVGWEKDLWDCWLMYGNECWIDEGGSGSSPGDGSGGGGSGGSG